MLCYFIYFSRVDVHKLDAVAFSLPEHPLNFYVPLIRILSALLIKLDVKISSSPPKTEV